MCAVYSSLRMKILPVIEETCFVLGGRNGYGAKLCNIFSTAFTVETQCNEYSKYFKQVKLQCILAVDFMFFKKQSCDI